MDIIGYRQGDCWQKLTRNVDQVSDFMSGIIAEQNVHGHAAIVRRSQLTFGGQAT